MGLSLFSSRPTKPDHLLAVDLGGCQTKALQLQRKGHSWHLIDYGVMDAPPPGECRDPEILAQHFKAILESFGNPRVKHITVSLGLEEAVVRTIELPMMAPEDVRQMLKLNSKNYLQLELPDHVFDCAYLPPRQVTATEPGASPAGGTQKFKVLVTGAPRKLVEAIQQAAKAAGLIPEGIVPCAIGLPNAFEAVEPDVFNKEIIGLVDIGYRNSSIVILDSGEILLNRVLNIGSERLTVGLAEAMGITPSEAEGIKIGMAPEVAQTLEAVINPLGREVRASLDFFEHQHDRPIGQVFLSGGAARNEVIVQALQNELMVPCRNWNPLRSFQSSLPPEKQGAADEFAPQLSVAAGTGVSSF